MCACGCVGGLSHVSTSICLSADEIVHTYLVYIDSVCMYMPDEAHGGQNLALCHLGNDLASVLNPKEVSQLLYAYLIQHSPS